MVITCANIMAEADVEADVEAELKDGRAINPY
jgi:hypothetical protein